MVHLGIKVGGDSNSMVYVRVDDIEAPERAKINDAIRLVGDINRRDGDAVVVGICTFICLFLFFLGILICLKMFGTDKDALFSLFISLSGSILLSLFAGWMVNDGVKKLDTNDLTALRELMSGSERCKSMLVSYVGICPPRIRDKFKNGLLGDPLIEVLMTTVGNRRA